MMVHVKREPSSFTLFFEFLVSNALFFLISTLQYLQEEGPPCDQRDQEVC